MRVEVGVLWAPNLRHENITFGKQALIFGFEKGICNMYRAIVTHAPCGGRFIVFTLHGSECSTIGFVCHCMY